MKQYLDTLKRIMAEGDDCEDRTGTGTRAIFGAQMSFDLRDGFPLVTTKKVWTKGIIHELLWFLSGSTNVAPLQEAGIKIWDDWATKEQCAKFGRPAGELGPVYGHAWRNFGATSRIVPTNIGGGPAPHNAGLDFFKSVYNGDGIDQITKVIEQIRTNPNSRRLIVSAWDPAEADTVALPPCHTLFQFKVVGRELSLQLYQRSGDMFLGVPFNIASYALLLSMVAKVTGLAPRHFIHTIGDAHIYRNHFEQVEEQVGRAPRTLPTLSLVQRESVFDFRPEDVEITGYDPHPAIRGEVSV